MREKFVIAWPLCIALLGIGCSGGGEEDNLLGAGNACGTTGGAGGCRQTNARPNGSECVSNPDCLSGVCSPSVGGTKCPATGTCTSSLSVVWAQVPISGAQGCTIPGTRGTTYLPSGVLDVGLDQDYPYILYPLVQNNLIKAMPAMAEYNRIRVSGADVKLVPPRGVTFTPAADCPAEFFHPNPISVDPGREAAIVVQTIKPCHVPVLRAMFRASKPAGLSPDNKGTPEIFTAVVRVRGILGGTEIESEAFEFPIRVCLGCLQTGFNLPGYEDFDFPILADCRYLVENPYPGNTCNIAQDFGPVLCCSPDGQKIECPGRPRGFPVMP